MIMPPKSLKERKGREKAQLRSLIRKKKENEIFTPDLSYSDPSQEEEKEIERLLMEEIDNVVHTSEVPSIEPIIPGPPVATTTVGSDFVIRFGQRHL